MFAALCSCWQFLQMNNMLLCFESTLHIQAMFSDMLCTCGPRRSPRCARDPSYTRSARGASLHLAISGYRRAGQTRSCRLRDTSTLCLSSGLASTLRKTGDCRATGSILRSAAASCCTLFRTWCVVPTSFCISSLLACCPHGQQLQIQTMRRSKACWGPRKLPPVIVPFIDGASVRPTSAQRRQSRGTHLLHTRWPFVPMAMAPSCLRSGRFVSSLLFPACLFAGHEAYELPCLPGTLP